MPGATLKSANPLHIIGSVLLFGASFEFFLHRLPHHEYVEVIADKPRPKAETAAPAPPPAAAPSLPIVAASELTKPKAPARAARPAPIDPIPIPTDPVAPPIVVAMNWRNACTPEIGVLCNHIQRSRVRRCLLRYQDSLLRECRVALLGPGADGYSP